MVEASTKRAEGRTSGTASRDRFGFQKENSGKAQRVRPGFPENRFKKCFAVRDGDSMGPNRLSFISAGKHHLEPHWALAEAVADTGSGARIRSEARQPSSGRGLRCHPEAQHV